MIKKGIIVSVVLCIMDGWGISDSFAGNAIVQANTPTYDYLINSSYPYTTLLTHGERVGLPQGQAGNSEVGHTNLGAGRIIYSALPRLDNMIKQNNFMSDIASQNCIKICKESNNVLHVLGMVSRGGIHSHSNHIIEAVNLIASHGIKIMLHIFFDGRDTAQKSALEEWEVFYQALKYHDTIQIATISGRYYGMDRDNRWERVEAVYKAIVEGIGTSHTSVERHENIDAAITSFYKRGITDEFFKPSVISSYSGVRIGDSLISCNFRADRMRELISALLDPMFSKFPVEISSWASSALGFVEYYEQPVSFIDSIIKNTIPKNTLGEVLSCYGKTQLRIAETEKYPHVTYFFNNGIEKPWHMESRKLIDSPRDIATYDMKPEMSLPAVIHELEQSIKSREYDFILCNLANPDMVGHTGVMSAAIQAVEAVDTALARLISVVRETDSSAIITADHGNCENMLQHDLITPHPAHTINPVPLFIVDDKHKDVRIMDDASLCNVAPTVLRMMNIQVPPQMIQPLFC